MSQNLQDNIIVSQIIKLCEVFHDGMAQDKEEEKLTCAAIYFFFANSTLA